MSTYHPEPDLATILADLLRSPFVAGDPAEKDRAAAAYLEAARERERRAESARTHGCRMQGREVAATAAHQRERPPRAGTHHVLPYDPARGAAKRAASTYRDRVPFPRHARRYAQLLARSRRELERAVLALPEPMRSAVIAGARTRTTGAGGPRLAAVTARATRRRLILFLVLLRASEPSRRAGMWRVVHGLPMAAIAAIVPPNEDTGAHIHRNSLRAWCQSLESAGVLERVQPGPRARDVERGPSGWALNQYRIPIPRLGAGAERILLGESAAGAAATAPPGELDPPDGARVGAGAPGGDLDHVHSDCAPALASPD